MTRVFLFNIDTDFVRVAEERDINDHGTIIGKLTEEAQIPRGEFDARTLTLEEATCCFDFQVQVKKTEHYKFSAEPDEVTEYQARISLEISKVSKDYLVRDLKISRL